MQDEDVEVRRAAVMSVSTETYEMDECSSGSARGQRVTDVKVWTSLAAARSPSALRWDPVKQRFEIPPDLPLEPEPEPVTEPETEAETEAETEEETETEQKSKTKPGAAKGEKKAEKKRKKKKKKKKKHRSKHKPKPQPQKEEAPKTTAKKKPKKPFTLPDQGHAIVYAKLRSMEK